MYEEYRKAYRHYSATYGADTAIFYLVGKFYELYDSASEQQTPIRKLVEILDIKLTVKKGDMPGGEDGLFAGVPEQSLHAYATKLTSKGWTVVVFDQIKDAKGAVKERRAVRILTPGSHVEAATGAADACILAGIWLEQAAWGSRAPPSFGLVALDLTTGAIVVYEGQAVGKEESWTADDAFHFFQVHAPREAVVFWRGQAIDQPSHDQMRRQFGLLSSKLHIIAAGPVAQGGMEKPQVREDLLRRMIPTKGLLSVRHQLNLEGRQLQERALCALLHYVEELFPSAPSNLHCPECWTPASNLFLGNHALLQLNMLTPRQEDSVLGLFSKTRTPMGQRAMRRRILHPIADIAVLNRLYSEIEAIGALDSRVIAALERALDQIGDLPRLHRRIVVAQVSAADVLALDQSYSAAKKIVEILAKGPLAGSGVNIDAIHAALLAKFSVEKAKIASDDAAFLQDAAAPDVALQERTIAETYRAMNLAVEELTVWAQLPPGCLRLEFRETMGPVVLGPKAVMKLLAERLRGAQQPPERLRGIRFQEKKSGAGIEIPHLDTLFRAILRTRQDLTAAVRTALPPLCDSLADVSLALWDSLECWISRVDVSLTLWRVAEDHGFVRPLLVPGAAASVSLEGLRHPLIELTANRTEYVRHSVALGATGASGWLVYGMNASGKSSLMKAVGIAVLLAQAGCFVPASSMTLTPFRGLYTRILNTDNLWAGLSSFAVEMTELREILARADQHSLVLGDELCSGTESVSATALVGAGIQWLHERNARFIFATHLHGLMEIPSLAALSRLRVWHLKVHYDIAADRLIYDRTLMPGPGSSLYGLEVARAMNIPDEVLKSAHEIRRTLLGTATNVDAPGSAWNSEIQRRVCEMCGAATVRELEVHHIQPRATATATGRLPDGTHMNHPRNLIVLCETCHVKQHTTQTQIAPLKATSDGPMRMRVDTDSTSVSSSSRSKWSAEQMNTIQDMLRRFPKLAPKRLAFDLEQQHGIEISVASLRSIREKMV